MQKLDLRNNLNEIIKSLNSRKIIDLLNKNIIDRNTLLSLIVDSKGGFDQAISNPDKRKVFEQFETDKIYSTNNFSSLILFISTVTLPNTAGANNRSNFLSNNFLNDFYSFHKSLLSTFDLINNLLISPKDLFNDSNDFIIQEAQNKGNLILEIIDEHNVALSKLTETLASLQKLIEIVYFLYDKVEHQEFTEQPTVSMVDSGSDINFIFKLPEKAANLIAQIMKEFWDFISNNKGYKFDRKLETLEKTLTVLGKLKAAKDSGIIDAQTAMVIEKGIVENTERIILNNTLPKQIIIETKEFSNRQLLLEQNRRYQLEIGEKNSDSEHKAENIE